MLDINFHFLPPPSPKAHPCVRPRRLSHPPGGLFCRCVNKKSMYENFRYISPICQKATNGRICTKFGTRGRFVDVITCFDFFVDRLKDLEGSNFFILCWLSPSPLA